jgi:hypothetical protein
VEGAGVLLLLRQLLARLHNQQPDIHGPRQAWSRWSANGAERGGV